MTLTIKAHRRKFAEGATIKLKAPITFRSGGFSEDTFTLRRLPFEPRRIAWVTPDGIPCRIPASVLADATIALASR